ncbi:hypothetical protein [Shimia aestuarii]|uniref:Uncharacterized protein n=1 Tax=Shimia aestuarii TaxID=254406 RepID=A0A1I4KC00_9RHOB|nr:hypothetical protein [Shimia aestuarii]SFL76294.1 hypothetical protein SAMN04488042_1011414 [Shimia aestuarii]
MLNFLGTIAGNILGLAGILGFTLGLMTRNLFLAAGLGAVVGFVETMGFAGFDMAKVETLDLIIAIGVGLMAGALGCAVRVKGTTV